MYVKFVRLFSRWEHIQSGTENNFNTYPADRISNFNVLYDPTSVMHYSAWGFSRNGFATIVPHVSFEKKKLSTSPRLTE